MKALYYPHTEIVNDSILKTALLLWDEIRTIYPTRQSVRHSSNVSGEVLEATDLVVKRTTPSESQMHAAQRQLQRMLESGTLHRICAQPAVAAQGNRHAGSSLQRGYRIYHSKFLHQTW